MIAAKAHLRKPKIPKICRSCSMTYEVFPFKENQTNFCSKRCLWDSFKNKEPWNKGKVFDGGPSLYNWKGEDVGYNALHRWVRRKLGSANHCEDCGLNEIPKGKKRYFDWANISHEYRRTLEDWKQLCKKCHRAFDSLARRTANT